MTEQQFLAAKATFPWTEHVITNGRHTIVQMIDRNGNEVPIFTMTAFLTFMTAKIANVDAAKQ